MSVNFREEDPAPSKEVDDLFYLASYCALVPAIVNHQRHLGTSISKCNKQPTSLTLSF
jgi:hypothetical protein